MTTLVNGFFKTTHWEITPWDEKEGAPALSRYVQKDTFEGGVEGEAVMECLFIQHVDGSGDYMGLQRVTGRLGSRSGTFVLRHQGAFRETTTSGTFAVVAGSGTGELIGLKGEGEFSYSPGDQDIPYKFDYQFEDA